MSNLEQLDTTSVEILEVKEKQFGVIQLMQKNLGKNANQWVLHPFQLLKISQNLWKKDFLGEEEEIDRKKIRRLKFKK